VPIESEEADFIGRGLQDSILLFFKRHRFTAFSADEVLFELGVVGVMTTRELLASELTELCRLERLITFERDGEIYYRYDNRLGLRPPR
jgi:hypothetical protein